jgi:branched-chain amino acid transport system substrate-binding protein
MDARRRGGRKPAILLALLSILLLGAGGVAHAARPVIVGLDAEFGLIDSTSAQAIERGILIAIDEINAAGGVLDGRPLELRTTDNRSVTARGIANVEALAGIPELVAIFVGRFSPVVLEVIPTIHREKVILLDPWAAAEGIIRNGYVPNYAFRLSLRDSVALPMLMRHARARGVRKVGLLVPNTSWGRSSMDAVQAYSRTQGKPDVVAVEWFQWGDQTMIHRYKTLRAAGAEAIVFVANDAEAAFLVEEMAHLPPDELVPLICHWGVTGGRFAELVGDAFERVDITVIQTFSFDNPGPLGERVLDAAERLFGVTRAKDIDSPVGLAQAYDLTHILARAIELAGTTDRAVVRDALEEVRDHQGLVRYYERPFAPDNHEALGPEDAFMARYGPDGTLHRVVEPVN